MIQTQVLSLNMSGEGFKVKGLRYRMTQLLFDI